MARPSSPGPQSPQPHVHRSPARRGRRGTPRSGPRAPRAARPPEAQTRRSARGRPSLPSILSVASLVGPDRSDSSASTSRLLGASPGAQYRAGCLPAPARISFWSPGVLGPIITAPAQPRQHPAQDAARSPRLHGNRLAPPPPAGTLRPGDPRPRRGVEGARGEQTGLTREEGPLQQGAPSPTGPRTTADHRRRQLFGGPTPSAFGGGVSGQGCGRRGRAGGACRTGLLSGRRRWARDGHWSRKRDSSGLSEFKENRQGNRAAPDFEDGLTESKMVS